MLACCGPRSPVVKYDLVLRVHDRPTQSGHLGKLRCLWESRGSLSYEPSTRDIKEVQVDAVTGKVVSESTETPADQAKEAAEDRAKARSKGKQ